MPPDLGIRWLLMLSAEPWGATEPVLGNDIGFYVFLLPVLRTAIGLGVDGRLPTLHAGHGCLRCHRRAALDGWAAARSGSAARPPGRTRGAFLVLLAGQLFLGRYFLLLDGSSPVQGIFGFTDAEARLPALSTLSIITMAGAIGVLWGAWKNRAGPSWLAFRGRRRSHRDRAVLSQPHPEDQGRAQRARAGDALHRDTTWTSRVGASDSRTWSAEASAWCPGRRSTGPPPLSNSRGFPCGIRARCWRPTGSSRRSSRTTTSPT